MVRTYLQVCPYACPALTGPLWLLPALILGTVNSSYPRQWVVSKTTFLCAVWDWHIRIDQVSKDGIGLKMVLDGLNGLGGYGTAEDTVCPDA